MMVMRAAGAASESPEALFERVKCGDESALQVIWSRYYEQLCRRSERCGASPDDAESIVSDVLLSFWSEAPGRSVASIAGYLHGAVSLKTKEHLRKEAREHSKCERSASGKVEYSEKDIVEDMELGELERQLEAHVQGMPEKRREAYLLCRDRNMTHAQAAEVMGVAPATVKRHVADTYQELRIVYKSWQVQGA